MDTPNQPTLDLLPKDKAEELVDPYLPRLVGCIKGGWDAWERLGTRVPELRLPLSPRTRAAFVNDHICSNVAREFEGDSTVELGRSRGFLVMTIGGGIGLRFKKFCRGLRTSNIPTKQQIEWALQLTLPDMKVTRLNMGYQLDKMQAAIRGIFLTCPQGKRNLWSLAVPDLTDTTKPMIDLEIVQMPTLAPKAKVKLKVLTNDGPIEKSKLGTSHIG